jgi:hypothetical protein
MRRPVVGRGVSRKGGAESAKGIEPRTRGYSCAPTTELPGFYASEAGTIPSIINDLYSTFSSRLQQGWARCHSMTGRKRKRGDQNDRGVRAHAKRKVCKCRECCALCASGVRWKAREFYRHQGALVETHAGADAGVGGPEFEADYGGGGELDSDGEHADAGGNDDLGQLPARRERKRSRSRRRRRSTRADHIPHASMCSTLQIPARTTTRSMLSSVMMQWIHWKVRHLREPTLRRVSRLRRYSADLSPERASSDMCCTCDCRCG